MARKIGGIMSVDFHTPLTKAQIEDMNTAIRGKVFTSSEVDEMVEMTGLTRRHVLKFLTVGSDQRNLIPLSMAGTIPIDAQSRNTEQMAARLAIGMLFTEGVSGNLFTKKDYQKDDTKTTITQIVSHFHETTRDPYKRLGIKGYHVEPQEGAYKWIFDYASPQAGEYQLGMFTDADDESDDELDDLEDETIDEEQADE